MFAEFFAEVVLKVTLKAGEGLLARPRDIIPHTLLQDVQRYSSRQQDHIVKLAHIECIAQFVFGEFSQFTDL